MNAPKPAQRTPLIVVESGWVKTAAFVGLLGLAGCVAPAPTPQNLAVPSDQEVLLHAFAKGVQIYLCESGTADPSQSVWKLKAPEAMLFDACGNVIGSHYAGPTWELDRDGSKVTGVVVQRAAAPDVTAIPWLLAEAKATQGTGGLARVTYIQRVNTTGGLPPAISDAKVGEEVRSHYTAEYRFYREARK